MAKNRSNPLAYRLVTFCFWKTVSLCGFHKRRNGYIHFDIVIFSVYLCISLTLPGRRPDLPDTHLDWAKLLKVRNHVSENVIMWYSLILSKTPLRIPDSYDAKLTKMCNLWTFWPVIQLITHLAQLEKISRYSPLFLVLSFSLVLC